MSSLTESEKQRVDAVCDRLGEYVQELRRMGVTRNMIVSYVIEFMSNDPYDARLSKVKQNAKQKVDYARKAGIIA